MKGPHRVLTGKTVLFTVSFAGLAALAAAYYNPRALSALGFASPFVFISPGSVTPGELLRMLAPAYVVGIILFALLATQASHHACLSTLGGTGLYALDTWAAISSQVWTALPLHGLLMLAFVLALKNEFAAWNKARHPEGGKTETMASRLGTVINRQVMIGGPGLAKWKPGAEDLDDDDEGHAVNCLTSEEMHLTRRTYHGRSKK